MNEQYRADAMQIRPSLDLLATQGGRHGRCWLAEPESEPVWRSAADVLRHPLFGTLPHDDRERVRLLALVAASWPSRAVAR